MWMLSKMTTKTLPGLCLSLALGLSACPAAQEQSTVQEQEQRQPNASAAAESPVPETTTEQHVGLFRITIEGEKEGNKIKAKGLCTLPDQAIVLVSLLDPQKEAKFNQNVISQQFGFVKNNEYQAEIELPPDLAPGSYILRARFTPQSHDPSGGKVSEAVGGPTGSKLSGTQVVEEEGVKMLVAKMEFTL